MSGKSPSHHLRIFRWLIPCIAFPLLAVISHAESAFLEIAELGVGRNSHTATLLADGRVLIAGGRNAKHQPIASAEIYDPGSKSFSPTGSLASGRYDHHATLLPNQKVLVTGGGALTAEIYDPVSGVWSVTQPSDGQPGGDSATLLANGLVLVIGGMDSSQLGISRLYDPESNSWTRTGSLELARKEHTATLLQDGRVLVSGGQDYINQSISYSAEIYNPSDGTWTSAGLLINPRHRHTATLLPDGQVLLCGGRDRDALASTELFDPASGLWAPGSPLSIERENHTAVLLADNKLLVSGGVPVASTVLASSEILDPLSGSWTAADSLVSSRCLHAATRLNNGNILITGGWGAYNRRQPGDFDLTIKEAEEYGPPVPEITVKQGESNILSGGTVGFGTVLLGDKSTRHFTIWNTGTVDLAGLELTINGSHFAATPSTLPQTLAAGQKIEFSISFSPAASGPAAATLTLSSNDEDEGAFIIALTGEGTKLTFPEITVEQPVREKLQDGASTTDFGDVKLGKAKTKTFTVRNTGDAPLTGLSVRTTGKFQANFTVTPLPETSLAAGASAMFKVTFTPNSTGSRKAGLRILSNDANESPFDITLTGNGARP